MAFVGRQKIPGEPGAGRDVSGRDTSATNSDPRSGLPRGAIRGVPHASKSDYRAESAQVKTRITWRTRHPHGPTALLRRNRADAGFFWFDAHRPVSVPTSRAERAASSQAGPMACSRPGGAWHPMATRIAPAASTAHRMVRPGRTSR